jgi:hypothetical protein|tara:strand:+ start:117 stop:653 length:537 start_codon:yes stop_codon:yes gene_type:complete
MGAALPFIALAGAAVSAYGQVQAGRAQAKALGKQGALAELQGRGEALKYRQQGVATMDRVLRTRATVNARAAAGGIDPFAGSALALQDFALAEGAREIYVSRDNEIIAREGGTLQSSLYQQQGKQAYRGGLFGAMGTLASAGASFAKTRQPPKPVASSATRSYAPYQSLGGGGAGMLV